METARVTLHAINGVDYGPDGPAGEWDLDALRDRYSVVETMIRKTCTNPSRQMIDDATRAYAIGRESERIWRFEGGEAPEGWRCVLLKGVSLASQRLILAGVRADGMVIQGETPGNFQKRSDVNPGAVAAKGVRALEEGADHWRDTTRNGYRFTLSGFSSEAFAAARSSAALLADMVSEIVSSQGAQGREADHLYSAFSGILMGLEVRRRKAASAALMNALDPEVRRLMYSTAENRPGMANALTGFITDRKHDARECGTRKYKVCHDLGQRRQQAVASYPLLFEEMAMSWGSVSLDVNNTSLGKRVDEGLSLMEGFKEAGVSRAQARRLRGLTWQKAGREAYRGTRYFLDMIGRVDPNHIPDSRRGYAEFFASMEAVETYSEIKQCPEAETTAQLGGRWDKMASLLEGNPARGLEDFDAYLNKTLVMPAAFQAAREAGQSEEAAAISAQGGALEMDSLATRHPIRGAYQFAGRWHTALPRLNDMIVERDEALTWEPLAGEVDVGQGIRAVELSGDIDLKAEGVQQNHCVGGYADDVLQGRCVIFSLRKGEEILSTVEIDPWGCSGENTKARIVQNYGRGNSEPGREAELAARRLLSKVKSLPQDQKSAYSDAIEEKRKARDAGKCGVGKLCRGAGYDVTDPAKIDRAWKALAPLLPRAERKKGWREIGREALAAAPEIKMKRETSAPMQHVRGDDFDEIPF